MAKSLDLWPTDENPCFEQGKHPSKSALYGVKGKVTKLCVYCVTEKAKAMGMDAALETFTPDPSGANVQP